MFGTVMYFAVVVMLTIFAAYLSGRGYFKSIGMPMEDGFDIWWPFWGAAIIIWPISLILFVIASFLGYVYDMGKQHKGNN